MPDNVTRPADPPPIHLAHDASAVTGLPFHHLPQPRAERRLPSRTQDLSRLVKDADEEGEYLGGVGVLNADADGVPEGRVRFLGVGANLSELGQLRGGDGRHPLGREGCRMGGGGRGEVRREDEREDGRVGAAAGQAVQREAVAAQEVEQRERAVGRQSLGVSVLVGAQVGCWVGGSPSDISCRIE